MTTDDTNPFSKMSEDEIVQAHGQVGNPSELLMLRAEERRRERARQLPNSQELDPEDLEKKSIGWWLVQLIS